MRPAHENMALCQHELDDLLYTAFSWGLPQAFNIEWLIDKAELGEWGGLWW